MALQARAQAALAEKLDLVPSTTWQLTTVSDSSSFWPPKAPGMYMCTDRHTISKIIIIDLKKQKLNYNTPVQGSLCH